MDRRKEYFSNRPPSRALPYHKRPGWREWEQATQEWQQKCAKTSLGLKGKFIQGRCGFEPFYYMEWTDSEGRVYFREPCDKKTYESREIGELIKEEGNG